MNRFAHLLDRLATHPDPEMQIRLLADYFAATPEAERGLAAAILTSSLKPRRVKLAFVRGLAERRLDPALFALSLDYVGDMAETIALLWPARRGANKDPSLGDIVEALSSLGKSELPKRIETWFDATDAHGRWALIKLMTGTLRAPVPAAQVRKVFDPNHKAAAASTTHQAAQDELFREHRRPAATAKRKPQTIDAVLMYVERNMRLRSSPTTCTFGAWNGDSLVPVGKADLAHDAADAQRVTNFVAENTIARFGPVREVAHEPGKGLVLSVAFEGIERAARRKAGITLRSPRVVKWRWKKAPGEAATLAALERLAPRG